MATTVTLKPNAIDISGSTSGTTTLQATAVAGTTTLTLPAATDTLVGKATTDTLTNKTLTTPSVSSPTISDGTANGVAYLNGSKVLTTGSALVFDGSNLGVGVTPSAWKSNYKTIQYGSYGSALYGRTDTLVAGLSSNFYENSSGSDVYISNGYATRYQQASGAHSWLTAASGTAGNAITFTQAMTLDASGNLLVGKTSSSSSTAGAELQNGVGGSNAALLVADGQAPLVINRLTNDGTLVSLRQAGTEEGTISVSGTTVSYNGGHLSRWAQTTAPKDDTLVKGTVLSNLDAMNVYTDAKGNPVDNEQLNKVKVSDIEGDVNVAGVFVNWSHDEDHNVDEINMAMTGDMIIRIAQGVTVARGDLLMSAGDGTAKPQGDDIVRSKTVAKVTSTHVTCTYADGSYCVPCVLMAC